MAEQDGDRSGQADQPTQKLSQPGEPQWAESLDYPTTQAFPTYPPAGYPGVDSTAHPGTSRYGYGAPMSGPTAGDPAGAGWPPPAGAPTSVLTAPPEPPKRATRRTVGLASAALAGVGLLIVGLGVGFLIGVSQTPTPSSLAGPYQPSQQAPANPYAPAPAPAPDQQPGQSGGSEQQGQQGGGSIAGAVGTIASISGDSFSLKALDGSSVAVKTTSGTRVASLRGSGGLSSLSVGDAVVVKGRTGADGTITADLVIAGSLPNFAGRSDGGLLWPGTDPNSGQGPSSGQGPGSGQGDQGGGGSGSGDTGSGSGSGHGA